MKATFLSRFTPGLMEPQALEAIFVQREALAQRMMDLILDLRHILAMDCSGADDPTPDIPASGRGRFRRAGLAAVALLLVILASLVYYLLVR